MYMNALFFILLESFLIGTTPAANAWNILSHILSSLVIFLLLLSTVSNGTHSCAWLSHSLSPSLSLYLSIRMFTNGLFLSFSLNSSSLFVMFFYFKNVIAWRLLSQWMASTHMYEHWIFIYHEVEWTTYMYMLKLQSFSIHMIYL